MKNFKVFFDKISNFYLVHRKFFIGIMLILNILNWTLPPKYSIYSMILTLLFMILLVPIIVISKGGFDQIRNEKLNRNSIIVIGVGFTFSLLAIFLFHLPFTLLNQNLFTITIACIFSPIIEEEIFRDTFFKEKTKFSFLAQILFPILHISLYGHIYWPKMIYDLIYYLVISQYLFITRRKYGNKYLIKFHIIFNLINILVS